MSAVYFIPIKRVRVWCAVFQLLSLQAQAGQCLSKGAPPRLTDSAGLTQVSVTSIPPVFRMLAQYKVASTPKRQTKRGAVMFLLF